MARADSRSARDGLLDEDVDPGLGQSQRHRSVIRRGHRNDGRLDALLEEAVQVRMGGPRLESLGFVPTGIDRTDQPSHGQLAEHAYVVAAHGAEPDHADAHPVVHAAPSSTAVATAASSLFGQIRPHREADHLGTGPLRLRQIGAGIGEGGLPVAACGVVDAEPHSGGLQGGHQAGPVGGPHRVLMVRVGGFGVHPGSGDDSGQAFAEEGGVGVPPFDPAGEAAQLHSPDGRRHVRHPDVGARPLMPVRGIHAVVPQQPGLGRQVGIGGGDHPTLTGGHVLGRVEGEGADGSCPPYVSSLPAGPVGLSGVLHQMQAVPSAQRR